MKPIWILFFAALLATSFAASAQYTVLVPADAKLITSDSIISLNPGGPGVNHSFLVCQGKKLKLNGISTYMVRVYLEENAMMDFDTTAFSLYLVGDYFMKQNSVLDFNKHMGSPIDTLMAQNTVSVLDTQTILPAQGLPCATLSFDYSLLPGGVSPCAAAPTGVYPAEAQAELLQLPTLVHDKLIFTSTTEGQFTLFDHQGRRLRQMNVSVGTPVEISLTAYVPGMYYYSMLSRNGGVQRGRVLVH